MYDILIISDTLTISGAEYVLYDYIKKSKNSNKIIIVHSDITKVNNFYSNFRIKRNYTSKYLNPIIEPNLIKFKIKKVFRFFKFFMTFFNIISNNNISIIIGNNTYDYIFSLYAKFFKKKFILYVHDIINKETLNSKLIVWFDKFIDVYIAVSDPVKSRLLELGISANKIIIIYNGLEPKKLNLKTTLNNKTLTFGFVGLMNIRKNPLEFIEFILKCNKLIDLNIRAKMVYKTQGEESVKLLKIINKLIKSNNIKIELIGELERNKINKFYESIDFLVITSKNDPFPTVVLESLNNSIPVIGRNIDGIPIMIQDGYNGFIYNTTDDFDNLIERILLVDYKTLQINASKTIYDKFSLQKKVDNLDDLL